MGQTVANLYTHSKFDVHLLILLNPSYLDRPALDYVFIRPRSPSCSRWEIRVILESTPPSNPCPRVAPRSRISSSVSKSSKRQPVFSLGISLRKCRDFLHIGRYTSCFDCPRSDSLDTTVDRLPRRENKICSATVFQQSLNNSSLLVIPKS